MVARVAGWMTCMVVLGLAVVDTESQARECNTVEKAFVLNNLGKLTAEISNISQWRELALRPLINHPRVSGSHGNSLARTHIKTWMSAMGWAVEEDSFTEQSPHGFVRFSNIIATLEPSKPRRVVLACHYDTKYMPHARFVGATDSAVPCSLLMDTAFRLHALMQRADNNLASDLTLQFIFFDGEEAFAEWSRQDSLYGSRHLAETWALSGNLQAIEVLILLDLIGTSDTHFKLKSKQTAPLYNRLKSIESCLRSKNLLKSTRNPGPLFTAETDLTLLEDDHLPFLIRGVPILHLITSPFPLVWHTPSDDLSALDFNRIENLARILRVFFVDLLI